MKPAVFPRAWGWFFDEVLPVFVKNHYSPKENWKERPFSRPDAIFFLKGVRELSDQFTDNRDSFRVGYFAHPKFRSSYLLYFLPLQAAKFLLLMNQHRDHVIAVLEHGKKTGVLRIADVGAGPGTASIAFLLYLLANHSDSIPDRIEFMWCDESEKMMEDGARLVQELCLNFRPLEGKVTVKLHVGDWRRHRFVPGENYDLSFFGHVLNEGKSLHQADRLVDNVRDWVERSGVGGVLFVEPAFRASSQLIGKIRDSLVLGSAPAGVEAESFERRVHNEPMTPLLRGTKKTASLLKKAADRERIAAQKEAADFDSQFMEANEGDVPHPFAEGGISDDGSVNTDDLLDATEEAKLTKKAKKGEDLPIGIVGPCLHEGRCPLSVGKDWCHFSVKAETPGKWFEFFSKGLSSQKEWIKYSYLWLRANPPAKKKPIDPMLRLVLTDSLTKNPKGPQMFLLCEPGRPRRITVPRGEFIRRGDLHKLSNKPVPENAREDFSEEDGDFDDWDD